VVVPNVEIGVNPLVCVRKLKSKGQNPEVVCHLRSGPKRMVQ
jgi:hypothetical protein